MNLVTPSPSHSATESQSLWFSVKIFIKSALAWGPKKILSLGTKLTLGGPVSIKNVCHSFRKERNKKKLMNWVWYLDIRYFCHVTILRGKYKEQFMTNLMTYEQSECYWSGKMVERENWSICSNTDMAWNTRPFEASILASVENCGVSGLGSSTNIWPWGNIFQLTALILARKS